MKKIVFPAALFALLVSAGAAQAWQLTAAQVPARQGITGATLDTVLPDPRGVERKWRTVSREISQPMTLRECFSLGRKTATENPEGTVTITCKQNSGKTPVAAVYICDVGTKTQGAFCWAPRMQ